MEHVKRSTFKLLFHLKKNEPKKNGNEPVMWRITIDGTPKTFGTRLEINPETWDLKHGRVLGKSNLAININQKLDKIRVRINKIYEDSEQRKEAEERRLFNYSNSSFIYPYTYGAFDRIGQQYIASSKSLILLVKSTLSKSKRFFY